MSHRSCLSISPCRLSKGTSSIRCTRTSKEAVVCNATSFPRLQYGGSTSSWQTPVSAAVMRSATNVYGMSPSRATSSSIVYGSFKLCPLEQLEKKLYGLSSALRFFSSTGNAPRGSDEECSREGDQEDHDGVNDEQTALSFSVEAEEGTEDDPDEAGLARLCVHAGDRVQAALLVERLPTQWVEPPWMRRWRRFRQDWLQRTGNALDIADGVAYMHFPTQFLDKADEEALMREQDKSDEAEAEQVRSEADELFAAPTNIESLLKNGSSRSTSSRPGLMLPDEPSSSVSAQAFESGQQASRRGRRQKSSNNHSSQGSELSESPGNKNRRGKEVFSAENQTALNTSGQSGRVPTKDASSSSRRSRKRAGGPVEIELDTSLQSVTKDPTETLYLLVQYRGVEGKWTVPRSSVLPDMSMRETLEALSLEQLGMEPHLVGRCPAAFERFSSSRKVFYYRGRITGVNAGRLDIAETSPVADYAWVPQSKLSQFLSKRALRTLSPLLVDWG
ncbi:unnamed protein product [Amoebophrya sp. A25]|nr:unnamed protein product [Amoebophrya sp. A25]|eukprot:GSA25T00013621001.1